MDVFEFAMKMEKDGQAYYEKMAAQTENAVLKEILNNLAQDEIKHYNLFKKFRDGDDSAVADMKSSGSKVMENARNVFQNLAAGNVPEGFTQDIMGAWKEAQNIEKKSEDFYREKAADETDEGIKSTILEIADEEHKHWVLIENVIRFLNRPKQWLEDAEWNHLDNY